MKFFGWGRKKDPPPISLARQKLEKSDAAKSPGATGPYGSNRLFGQEDEPHVQPSKENYGGAGVEQLQGSETWEERLQETIRFVFSHEQEGLLAIGTFALDQLVGVSPTQPHQLDGRQKPPAAPAAATDFSINSRRNSVSSVQVVIHDVRSSDDEIESQHSTLSPIPACKKRESYPVFGDHDTILSSASGVRALSVESSTKPPTPNHHPSPTTHTTHHKEPGITHLVQPPTAGSSDHSDEEDFYSPGVCGLLSSKSRRKGVKEKRKKPPESKPKGTGDDPRLELKKAASRGSQLRRLWRSSSTGISVSAKVTPEKSKHSKPSTPYHSDSPSKDPPHAAKDAGEPSTVDPKPSPPSTETGEQRKRRGHSFGKAWASCAHNGKWIRTDSEFLVLEM